MAQSQVQVPRLHRVRYADSHSPGKENIDPKLAKGNSHSSAKKDSSRSHKHCKDRNATAREVLAPLPAGVLKSAVAKEGFFKQFGKNYRRTNSEDDPVRVRKGFFAKYEQDGEQEQSLDLGFSDAAHTYCQSAASHLEQRQARRSETLTARQAGLDLNGNKVHRPGVPDQVEFDAIFAEMKKLDRDFEDEEITTRFLRPDGTSVVKVLRLGNTLEVLMERKERKQAKNAELEVEIQKIKEEMDALVKEVEGDSEEAKKIEAEYKAQMKALKKDEEEVQKNAKRAMKEMKKEEDEVTEQFNRKVEDLFRFAGGVKG